MEPETSGRGQRLGGLGKRLLQWLGVGRSKLQWASVEARGSSSPPVEIGKGQCSEEGELAAAGAGYIS